MGEAAEAMTPQLQVTGAEQPYSLHGIVLAKDVR